MRPSKKEEDDCHRKNTQEKISDSRQFVHVQITQKYLEHLSCRCTDVVPFSTSNQPEPSWTLYHTAQETDELRPQDTEVATPRFEPSLSLRNNDDN